MVGALPARRARACKGGPTMTRTACLLALLLLVSFASAQPVPPRCHARKLRCLNRAARAGFECLRQSPDPSSIDNYFFNQCVQGVSAKLTGPDGCLSKVAHDSECINPALGEAGESAWLGN